MVRSPLMTLGLLAAAPALLSAAEPSAAEKEARAVVERYFAAYAAKDLDALTGMWSGRAPDLARHRETLRRIFASTGDIRLKELTIVQAEVGEASARLRVHVELVGADKHSGKPYGGFGKLRRVLLLKRQEDRWKIWRYLGAERELLEQLLAARDEDSRQKIYRQNADLLTLGLVRLAGSTCLEQGRRGQFTEAFQTNDLGFEIARRLANRAALGWCHYYRGKLFDLRSQHQEALADSERSRTLFREAKDREGEALALDSLGALHHHTGGYAEALRCYQDSLKIERELGLPDAAAGTLNDIGLVYLNTGRYAEALRSLRDSLKIKHERANRAGEANTLNNIGLIHQATGRYADALRSYQDGLKVARELKDPAAEAALLANLGTIYVLTGRNAEGLRHCQDGLRITRRLGRRAWEGRILNTIGNVYQLAGRYAESRRHYQDSLEIARELKDRAAEAIVLGDIGMVADAEGRHADALRSYQEGLRLARQLRDREGEVRLLGNIGNAYRLTRQYPEALASHEEGRTVAESIGDLSGLFARYEGLGDVYRDQKDWPQAVAAYRQAVRHLEQIRSGVREQSLQSSFLALYLSPYHGLARCLLELGRPEEAFAFAEQARARALVDVLQTGKVNVHNGMSVTQRREERQLQEGLTALAVELENLRTRKLNPQRQQQLAGELVRARQDVEAFRRELYLHLPGLEVRRGGFKPATLAELGRELFAAHPKLLVLSYVVLDEETVLFALRPGERRGGPARLTALRVGGGEKELARAVEPFRGICRKPGAGTPDGTELYRLLLAPVEEMLAEAEQVVVLPDGPLHTLPFHALKDEEDGKYLIQRVAVSYAPSVTALAEMARLGQRRRQEHAAGGRLLAVGLSDFGRREPRLPAAEDEATEAARLFGEHGRVLLGGQATRSNLRSAWASCRYLHLATHGRLNEQVPLYSSVVLHPAGAADEGLLFGRDLLEEDLSAELVVLSACETALGKRQRGEGLLGLTWAWFVAGVPATIASQWSVADESTARLMQTFYTERKGGASKAEALRRAQLALLKDRKTRHPFYWAPFVLTGDPW